MKILTIIPARAGSKRVPGKNTKLLGGLPLIAHTIQSARQAGCCGHIMVSTESSAIAEIGQAYQAEVPWLRPNELALDSSSVMEAILHVLERYQAEDMHFDSVLLLQPTSPFRKPETIKKAMELHQAIGHSVVSVNAANLKPGFYKTLDQDDNLENPPEIYILNGAIYIARVETIQRTRSFYSNPTKAFIIHNSEECLDIDTLDDWAKAEELIKELV